MKKILLAAAAVSISGAASAQMTFQGGVIDFEASSFDYGTSIYAFSLGGRADYDIGTFGLQLDASANILTDFANYFDQYSGGVHIYKPFSNGTKIGGYAAIDFISFGGPTSDPIYNYGAEALISFGKIDVEASIGGLYVTSNPDAIGMLGLDAYFQISPAIEISAGVINLFNDTISVAAYDVSLTYMLQTLPIAFGANYTLVEYGGGGNFSTFGVSASYYFGGPSEERLFKTQKFPLAFFGA